MGNIFNDDFRDFLLALIHEKVRYILVGGFSVILHGYSRTTGDMDISVIFEDEKLKIRVIHKNDLIEAKKNAGRSKDLDDLENLA